MATQGADQWRKELTRIQLSELDITCDAAHLIGKGTYGKVYRARWCMTNYAVKVMPAKEGEEVGDLSMLTCRPHPNIMEVKAWCFDSSGKTLYIVFPLMEGGSLDEVLKEAMNRNPAPSAALGGPLGWPSFFKVALGVAHGLHHLARYGLIHRDLKPANILLDHEGKVFLADFGFVEVAKTARLNTVNTVDDPAGTVAYMSAEVFEGKAGPPSDVFSMGCVLWEIMTGVRPRKGMPPTHLLGAVMSGTKLDVPRGTPPWLAAIINDCQELEHRKRPTAEEVKNRLTAAFHEFHRAHQEFAQQLTADNSQHSPLGIHAPPQVLPGPSQHCPPTHAPQGLPFGQYPSPPSVNSPSWRCVQCTFDNPISDTVCKMCQGRRSQPTPPPNQWGCTRCTLLNRPEETICVACGASRQTTPPPDPPPGPSVKCDCAGGSLGIHRNGCPSKR